MREAELKEMILHELSWDPQVDEVDLNVSTAGQNVTIKGRVPTYLEKLAATTAVERVLGVQEINNEIEVHLPSEFRRDDAEVADRVATVFDWNSSVPRENVHFSVNNAHVTLTGEVDWHYQREELEKLVGQISFVKGISNNISLKPRSIVSDLKVKIEDALKRSAMQDAENVKISVSGDTVTLEGKVKAPYERQLIEQAVWAAPGIQHVIDNIAAE